MAKKKFHVDYSDELPEFTLDDLDDIMKEFGSEDAAPAPVLTPEQLMAQVAPEVELPVEEAPEAPAQPEQTEVPAEPVDYGPDVIPFTPMPLEEAPAENPEKAEEIPEAAPEAPAASEEAPEEVPEEPAAQEDEDIHVFTPKKKPLLTDDATVRLTADSVAAIAGFTASGASMDGATVRVDTDAVMAAVQEAEAAAEEAPVSGETVRIDTEAVKALSGAAEKEAAVLAGETVRLDYDRVNAMTAETQRIDTEAVRAMSAETQRLDTDAVRILADSEEAENAVLAAETQRIDYDRVNAMTAETRRIDTEAVAAAAEAAQPEQPEAPKSNIPEGAEPFSAGWEPHYEEPIGDYIPPQPIVFRPRSRLQELKKKLVSGPERRYYALIETGVGKLQAAILVSFLIFLGAAISVGSYQMDLVSPERMRLLVFGEFFAMMFCALLALDLIVSGLAAIVRKRFTLNSLLAISFFVCFVDGLYCLRGVRVPYCAAFCLEATAALLAEYQRRSTETGQMDTLRKATHLNRIAKAPDCFEGKDGFFLSEGEPEDFMETYHLPSAPEKTTSVYALMAFLASVVIGVLALVSSGKVGYGLQMWSAALMACAPATIFLAHTRPAAILERRLHRFGVVLCGWQGAVGACGNAVLPLNDIDLFPEGSVKINGVKAFSPQTDLDQIIASTAAILEHSGTVLAPLFIEMRDSRYGRHYDAENLRIYESGGLSGEIEGNVVLVGGLEFLKEMGVSVPEDAAVEPGVYTAVNGELASLCAMAFGQLKGVTAGLAALCSQQQLTPMMITENFLLTEDFVRGKFGIPKGRVLFPGGKQRRQVAVWQPDPARTSVCCLSTQESLAATGFAITGARSLVSSVRLGTTMHICGGILGLLLVLILLFVDGGSLLTPGSILLFQLIWAIPGVLITEWTRSL